MDDFSKEDLRRLINQLVSRRLIAKSGDEFPGLALTPRGREFLQARQEIHLPKPEAAAKPLQKRDKAATGYDQDLFEKLRLLRKELADEQGVPPFVVFGDLALQQMALYLPQSRESFAKISGVGEAKLKQYGKIFTGVIQAYAEDHELGEKEIPVKRSAKARRPTRLGPTYRETQELVAQKLSIDDMASRRGLTAGTIVAHIEKLVGHGENLDIGYLRPPVEHCAAIEAAFQRSGGTAVSAVRGLLGGQFSYEELRIARLFIKS